MGFSKCLKKCFLLFLWLIEEVIVGFGAILPGISGGTLCAAFGMYRPCIETISNIKSGIKKYGLMIGVFIIGVALGFVGLSGLAAYLMYCNAELVTCAFIGLIIGTIPELWRDAGSQGRNRKSYVSLLVGFAVMFVILFMLRTKFTLTVSVGIPAFLLCGILWGLSFIVPGLSSSSLLLFFGLYKPMLEGIYTFDMAVLIPMSISFLVCVLLLSKAAGFLYKRFFSIMSHAVLGVVAATVIMIMPHLSSMLDTLLLKLVVILSGAVASFSFTVICRKLKKKEQS